MNIFNGIQVARRAGTIFIPLPREAWVSCGLCQCSHCKGAEGFWDTIAVSAKDSARDYTWTVHAPEMQMRQLAAAWVRS